MFFSMRNIIPVTRMCGSEQIPAYWDMVVVSILAPLWWDVGYLMFGKNMNRSRVLGFHSTKFHTGIKGSGL